MWSESGQVLSDSVFLSLFGYQVLLNSQLCVPIELQRLRWRVIIRWKAERQSTRQPNGCFQPLWPLPSDAGAAFSSAVLCLHNTDYKETEMIVVTCCLCQVMRAACQPSLSKMRLFVCRHGERMDVVFGKHWVTQCFDSKG